MPLLKKIKRFGRIIRVTLIRKTIHLTRKIRIPGFEGISLWEVLFFFTWSVRRGLITTRAAAISFHFFLAMIPLGLILVVLSSQIPFLDIETDVAPVLSNFIPDEVIFKFLENISNYENSSVSSLLSFGFLLALYFTANGFAMLIKTFSNPSNKIVKQRKWWSVKIMAIGYVIVLLIAFLLFFFLILWIRKILSYLGESSSVISDHQWWIFTASSFILITVFIYLGVAMIYYFAPSNRSHFTFFSAGATLTTIMTVFISLGYSYYITEFARYSDFYGSLGTIMILLLWIYLNSLALLLGFELNASIHGALREKKLDGLEKIKNRYDKKY